MVWQLTQGPVIAAREVTGMDSIKKRTNASVADSAVIP